MEIRLLYKIAALLVLLFALGGCGGGSRSDAARIGATPCVWGNSSWDSGCTWGS